VWRINSSSPEAVEEAAEVFEALVLKDARIQRAESGASLRCRRVELRCGRMNSGCCRCCLPKINMFVSAATLWLKHFYQRQCFISAWIYAQP
jgi:hypothetical protein